MLKPTSINSRNKSSKIFALRFMTRVAFFNECSHLSNTSELLSIKSSNETERT